MLSQVERGETSPTLAIAARIAAGLGLRLSQLLRLDEDGAVTIVRAAQRRHGGNRRRGHRFEVMTAGQPRRTGRALPPHACPGGSTGAGDDPPMHEPGSRETALVESGPLVLVCDGQRHELSVGDCVTFDADLPHHFENPTTQDAALLAVVGAGSAAQHTRPDRASEHPDRDTDDAQDDVRQDLGGPRGRRPACSTSTCTSSTRSPARRPSTGYGSPAGGAPARSDAGHRRPQHADRRYPGSRADQGRALPCAGADTRAQLRGVRRPDLFAGVRRARASCT